MLLPSVSFFQHLLEARVFLVAIIISLIPHRRYIILETDSVVRRYTERRILDTVLHDSLHINLIQDCHGKCVIWQEEDIFTGKLCLNLRKKAMKSCIWSVALYGAETWTLRKID